MIGNNERCKLKSYSVEKEKQVWLVDGNRSRDTELGKKNGAREWWGRNLEKGEKMINMQWEFNEVE